MKTLTAIAIAIIPGGLLLAALVYAYRRRATQ